MNTRHGSTSSHVAILKDVVRPEERDQVAIAATTIEYDLKLPH